MYIYIVTVQRPPKGDVKEFVRTLEHTINNLRVKPNIKIIIGDMHLDIKKRMDTRVKRYEEFISRNSLSNIISSYTHSNEK